MLSNTLIYCLQAGPNVDLRKWQDEQIDKATVRFSAKDAKERNKVFILRWHILSTHFVCMCFISFACICAP